MSFNRLLHSENENGRTDVCEFVPIDEWLDDLSNEREIIMKRLRQIERSLVKHKRLRNYTLPNRSR